MILFVNPRATRPANRRFPLSLLALAGALPEGTTWALLDGNLEGADLLADACARVEAGASGDPVRLVAVTAMPGPQLVSAVAFTKEFKARHPEVPVAWGGYFPTLYPAPVVRAPFVDWAVRGQGERTLVDLLEVVAGRRAPETVNGLAWADAAGAEHVNAERAWDGPDAFPPFPFERIDAASYLAPTFLGRRNGVYQASIGCPYTCNFCGVIAAYGSREKQEAPARTEERLRYLVTTHGMDAVHFYDNNFFLREAHARELAERLAPLNLRWWCEARIDLMLRFSDETWRRLRESGLTMVFYGAESGSDETLRRMSKNLTTAQTLEVAARARAHGIVPEFSFVFGDPEDPEGDVDRTLAFVRKLKAVNPAMELITYFYTPTPQRRATFGNVDPVSETPATLEEWVLPEWVDWMTHENPRVPWMPDRVKAKVHDFELVLRSRFPSVHDKRTADWGKAVGRLLASRRWDAGRFENPRLLRAVRRLARRAPDDRQAYGHLRPASDAGSGSLPA